MLKKVQAKLKMVERDKTTPNLSDNTAHGSDAALDISIIKRIWQKSTTAELQLQLLMKLRKINLAVASVEEFIDNLEECKKSKPKNKSKDVKLARDIMNRKVFDAENFKREIETRKMRMRRKIDKVWGKNSSKTRNLMKMMRRENNMLRREIELKNKEKLEHLQEKYGEKNTKNNVEIIRYKKVSIFSEEEETKQEILIEEEVTVLGEIELDENEKSVLRLPPKFQIREKLIDEEYDVELEMAFAKFRWEEMKEGIESTNSEENDEKLTEEEI